MSRNAGKGQDDQVKLKKVLDELTKREENKFCADCGCRGPRWASINLGVFICIACSGIHRSLGVHLTFVRSVNLDSWTSEQVAQMQKWGNARAKEYFEANVPRDYRIPNEHASVREKEMWIRDKYERKRFISRDEPEPNDRRHGSRSKKRGDSEEEDERPSRNASSRTGSRNDATRTNSSSSRRTEPAPKAAVPTNDILSFDVFSEPTPAAPVHQPAPPPAPPAAAPAAPAQNDEWASFGGSSSNTQGFNDAFAQPAQTNQHQNKLANIMASFGTPAAPTAAPGFPPQGGMMPAPMGMGMPGVNPMMGQPNPLMGQPNPLMGQPNPMGMNPMMGQPNPMAMNPMMGQPNPMMMGQPNPMMMNPMMGQPNPMMMAQPNPMMGGFPGAQGMGGFPGQPMGGMPMNPMMGMQPNPMAFQQQQQQQGQNRPTAAGGSQGLNQPFVNLQGSGGAQGGSNPFF